MSGDATPLATPGARCPGSPAWVGSRAPSTRHPRSTLPPSAAPVWDDSGTFPCRFVHTSSHAGRTGTLRANDRQHLVALALHQLLGARLEVETQQRLGVRRPDVHVPI